MAEDELARMREGLKAAGEPDFEPIELDWDKLMGIFRHKLEMALARHPKVGAALSFKEGETLITDLSASLAYAAHRFADPTYE